MKLIKDVIKYFQDIRLLLKSINYVLSEIKTDLKDKEINTTYKQPIFTLMCEPDWDSNHVNSGGCVKSNYKNIDNK